MNFYPKTEKFKRTFKKRKPLKLKKSPMVFGDYGLILLTNLNLTSRHFFRYKMLLNKATKRSEKTIRFFWFKTFPHTPLTRKPKGLRMGKGKGKKETWVAIARTGIILIEFRNLRKGRAIYFLNQLSFKLPITTFKIQNSFYKTVRPLIKNKQSRIRDFWY